MFQLKIVLKSTYKNYTYFITFNSTWYCAYVIIPPTHPFFCLPYESLDISCHGGLTFSDHHYLIDQWCIGWDYGHIGDYNPNLPEYIQIDGFGIPPHHWTKEEIEQECYNVIEQLINAE